MRVIARASHHFCMQPTTDTLMLFAFWRKSVAMQWMSTAPTLAAEKCIVTQSKGGRNAGGKEGASDSNKRGNATADRKTTSKKTTALLFTRQIKYRLLAQPLHVQHQRCRASLRLMQQYPTASRRKPLMMKMVNIKRAAPLRGVARVEPPPSAMLSAMLHQTAMRLLVAQ